MIIVNSDRVNYQIRWRIYFSSPYPSLFQCKEYTAICIKYRNSLGTQEFTKIAFYCWTFNQLKRMQ